MTGRRKRWHGTRALLNRKGFQSTAAIVAEIEDTSTWGTPKEGEYIPSPEVKFQIANCDRSIEFMLDFGGRKDHANNLYKIDKMIAVLTEFRAGVELEGERWLATKGQIEE